MTSSNNLILYIFYSKIPKGETLWCNLTFVKCASDIGNLTGNNSFVTYMKTLTQRKGSHTFMSEGTMMSLRIASGFNYSAVTICVLLLVCFGISPSSETGKASNTHIC